MYAVFIKENTHKKNKSKFQKNTTKKKEYKCKWDEILSCAATSVVAKKSLKKKSGLNRIRTRDLCNASVNNILLSYEATGSIESYWKFISFLLKQLQLSNR